MCKRERNAMTVGCILLLCTFVFSTCSSRSSATNYYDRVGLGGTLPGKVWDPKYYVYNKGKYTFVKGRYRDVISRKKYWKKSLQGYCKEF